MIAPEQALALLAQVRGEREQVERLIDELRELEPRTDRDSGSLRAIGSILHDYYNGVERILSAIVRAMNSSPPAGSDWHRQLLIQSSREIGRVRPAILSTSARETLQPFLEFRHRFRHMYGFELEAEHLAKLRENLAPCWAEVKASLDPFERFLESLGTARGS